jgi:hypothetical protein
MGYAESSGYSDAIGDITLTDDVYSVSTGWFQVRGIWFPHEYGVADYVRHVYPLLNPYYNAYAALVITEGGARLDKWTTYRTGAWEQYDDKDYTLRTGHVRANEWKRGIVRIPERIISEAGLAVGLDAATIQQMITYARTHRSKILSSNVIRP